MEMKTPAPQAESAEVIIENTLKIPEFDDDPTPSRKRRSFKGAKAFGQVPDPSLFKESAKYDEDDFGFGRRIALHFQDELMFVPGDQGQGMWYVYETGFWHADPEGRKAGARARIVAATLDSAEMPYYLESFKEHREAAEALKKAEALLGPLAAEKAAEELSLVTATLAKNRLAWAKLVKSGPVHINAALKAIEPLLEVSASELDKHMEMINTPAGLLNLRTLKVLPHRPEHYATKITSVSYNPKAAHPDVENVLAWQDESIPGMRASITRFLGMGLTGKHAKRMLYMDGPSDSGKSTIFEAAVRCMGDVNSSGYGRLIKPVILTGKASDGERAQPGLHELRGVRLAFGDEADRVGFLNSGLVKPLVSGGTQVTRALHQGVISWRSQVTLVLAGNGTMPIADDDAGMRRRFLTAKMHKELSADAKDEGLETRMMELEQQEALFAEMCRGAQAWLLDGASAEALLIPEAVTDSTAEYLEKSNPLTEWISEMIDLVDPDDPTYLPMITSVWAKIYNTWASGVSTRQMTPKRFGERLDQMGITTRDTRRVVDGYFTKGYLRLGLKLRDVSPAELHARGYAKPNPQSTQDFAETAFLHAVPTAA